MIGQNSNPDRGEILLFANTSRTPMGSVQRLQRTFCQEYSSRSVRLTMHLHLMPKYRMCVLGGMHSQTGSGSPTVSRTSPSSQWLYWLSHSASKAITICLNWVKFYYSVLTQASARGYMQIWLLSFTNTRRRGCCQNYYQNCYSQTSVNLRLQGSIYQSGIIGRFRMVVLSNYIKHKLYYHSACLISWSLAFSLRI
jgi:hypothetical protein